MTSRIRLPLAVGGLGAVVLLGLGANLAIGGGADRTDQVRSALHGGTAKNFIFLLGDGMGSPEVTTARYHQYGAAGRQGPLRPDDRGR